MNANIETDNRFRALAEADINELFCRFGTDEDGRVTQPRPGLRAVRARATDTETLRTSFRRAFVNPFTVILALVAIVSFVADVIFASNYARSTSSFPTLVLMIVVSGFVRLFFELRARSEAEAQTAFLRSTSEILINGVKKRIPSSQLKEGALFFSMRATLYPPIFGSSVLRTFMSHKVL